MLRGCDRAVRRSALRRRLGVGLGLAVVVLAGLACSTRATELDPRATEAAVGAAVADALELAVVATSCPDDLPRGQGREFACEVELADEIGTVPVAVVQVDDDGALSAEPGAVVLADEQVADQLRDALTEEFDRTFMVDCGDGGPAVRLPDDTFNCRARDSGGPRTVRVTVVDAEGTLSFDVGS